MIAPLLSPAEAARLLAISVRCLRQHVDAGNLPAVAIGQGEKHRRLRFNPDDIERFIAHRTRFLTVPEPDACPSTSRKNRRITPTTSSSTIVAFSDLRAQKAAAKPRK